MNKLFSIFIIILFCVFNIANVYAAHGSYIYVPLDKRVAESDFVIEAKFISKKGHVLTNKRGSGTIIVTSHILEVLKVFKGEAVNDTICLLTTGGRVFDEETKISSSHGMSPAAYLPNEGIYFLKENGHYKEHYKLEEADLPKGYKQYIITTKWIPLGLSFEGYVFVEYPKDEKNKNYLDLDGLYNKIEKLCGVPIEKRKENNIEKSDEKWIEEFYKPTKKYIEESENEEKIKKE